MCFDIITVRHTAGLFNDQRQQAISGIAVTVLCAWYKIGSARILYGVQHVFVSSVFYYAGVSK